MMEMTDPADALRCIRDSDEPPSAHLSALQFLSKLSFDEFPPGCLPSVLMKLDSPDERIRETVLLVLEHVDPCSINSRVLTAVVRRLNDPDETAAVKVAAARVVGMVDPEALDGVLAEEELQSQRSSQRSSRSSRSYTDEPPPTLRERVVLASSPAAKSAAALTSAIGRGIRRATSFERSAPAKSAGRAATGGLGPQPTAAVETSAAPAAPPTPTAPPAPSAPPEPAAPLASATPPPPPPAAAPPLSVVPSAPAPHPPPVRILGKTGAINPATKRFEELGAESVANPCAAAGLPVSAAAADAGSSASHAGRAQRDFVRTLKFGRRSISAAASAAAAAASAALDHRRSSSAAAAAKASGPAGTDQLPDDLEQALHPAERLPAAASTITGGSHSGVGGGSRGPATISKAAKAEARAKAEEVLNGSLDVSSDEEPIASPQEEMGYLE